MWSNDCHIKNTAVKFIVLMKNPLKNVNFPEIITPELLIKSNKSLNIILFNSAKKDFTFSS